MSVGGRRAVAAAMAAAVIYAAALPWVLRPWLLAADLVPRSRDAMAAIVDADLFLNMWILTWIAHAAVHAPGALFDGNVFHPARHVIVGSENMLAHLPVTVPALALTGNALAVLKTMAVESFVVAGLGMYLLVARQTGDRLAALVAGAAYAFTPLRTEALPQPQYLATGYLPLALLAVDVWVERGRRCALVGLAAALTLQGLACIYLGYFAFLLVPVYAVVRAVQRPRGLRLRATTGLALAGAAAALVLLPVVLPYARARASGVLPARDLAALAELSFAPWGWVDAHVVRWIGIVAAIAAPLGGLVHLVRRARAREPRRDADDRVVALWVLAAAAMVLATGPFLRIGGVDVPMPYRLAYALVPGFSTVRAPARFLFVAATALSALAGHAIAAATRGWPLARRVGLAAALVGLAAWHAAPEPAPTTAAQLGPATPEPYRWIARQAPGGAVLEVPGGLAEAEIIGNLRNARYMVWSTTHWHPLVNGYTGYEPPTAPLLRAVARRLPAEPALQLLVDLVDVRWLVLHRAWLDNTDAVTWSHGLPPGLVRLARFGDDDVFVVTRLPRHAWRDELLARATAVPPTTITGTPRAPLAPSCRRGRILRADVPPVLLPYAANVVVPISFVNDSDCTWPGLDVHDDGLVGVRYTWTSPTGERFAGLPFTRLVADVAPGATVQDSMVLAPPGGPPGFWTCVVELAQRDVDEPIATFTAVAELRQP